ncbi:MAG: DUF4293 domain-containing protein [Bacteroidales bacterium]|nr:DUF4293 domain-containing protein [Bacteroidales bacterium]MCF8388163.1 DUF4293 domain-containing protein [Bacteroidales bacterium]MCF8399107.1 DUF4293 domain-containing protein [Bacteroidales bacterium]
MIQRIQSLLLLIVVAANVLIFFFPIATFENENLFYVYHLYIYQVSNMVPGSENLFADTMMLPLAAGVIVIGLLALITIFLYKTRLMQMRIIKIDIFLNILLIVVFFFFFVNTIETKLETTADYHYLTVSFPLISLLFLVLSYRAILRDEKLVRSADRLR